MSGIVPKGSQVFTPPDLAEAMVRAVLQAKPKSWLEPSAGAGVFVNSLLSAGCDPATIFSLELDSRLDGKWSRRINSEFGVDALSWLRLSEFSFDAVVGNPPYAALSDVSRTIQESALSITDLGGQSVKLASNLWAVFVLAAVQKLSDGGSLCFVLPASWDFADYARSIRQRLPMRFETFHVFRSVKPMFTGVSEGNVVILGTGFGLEHKYSARVECSDLAGMCAALADFQVGARIESKSVSVLPKSNSGPKLGDFARIRLGGVTGDTNYFTLSEAERLEFGLPISALRRVVSRARHLQWPQIGIEEWKLLRDDGQKVWLFRPSDAALALPSVKRYLTLGLQDGGCDRRRFKIRSRDPWYLTPLPQSVSGFLSGMSTRGPRISFSNLAGLTATNTLYVVSFLKMNPAFQRNIALQLLSEPVLTQLAGVQRKYAGGLKKLEPRDILELRIDRPNRAVSEKQYREAFERSSV